MKYLITIKAKNNIIDTEFSGEFGEETGTSEALAIEEAKDFYACELDTTEDQIEIISVKEIK